MEKEITESDMAILPAVPSVRFLSQDLVPVLKSRDVCVEVRAVSLSLRVFVVVGRPRPFAHSEGSPVLSCEKVKQSIHGAI